MSLPHGQVVQGLRSNKSAGVVARTSVIFMLCGTPLLNCNFAFCSMSALCFAFLRLSPSTIRLALVSRILPCSHAFSTCSQISIAVLPTSRPDKGMRIRDRVLDQFGFTSVWWAQAVRTPQMLEAAGTHGQYSRPDRQPPVLSIPSLRLSGHDVQTRGT